MRAFLCLLSTAILAAQVPEPPGEATWLIRGTLGGDPAQELQFAPPGCFEALLFGAATQPQLPGRRTRGEATVEVWGLLPPASTRQEAFGLYLASLRERLSKSFAQPPPSHGKVELADLMSSDPSNPQKLDLTKVKSMQERFNRLPPSGSSAKPLR